MDAAAARRLLSETAVEARELMPRRVTMDAAAARRLLSETAVEARELMPRRVREVEGEMGATEFLREHVVTNLPVVMRGAYAHTPAARLWGADEYLLGRMEGRTVRVAASPTGYVDAEEGGRFALPEEREMLFSDFVAALGDDDGDALYAQQQNGSLSSEYGPLFGDAPEPALAREAFGAPPEAVNFWMGTSRSVTSAHSDPYNNLYGVLRGTKVFYLLPPTDAPLLPRHVLRPARWRKRGGGWTLEDDEDGASVSWVTAEFDRGMRPGGGEPGQPFEVEVRAGDLLYLPVGWTHHVEQRGRTVAVNWWYEAPMGGWAYAELLRKLAVLAGG